MDEILPALGIYPVNRKNRERLAGMTFKEVSYSKDQKAKVFIFTDEYRRVNVDLLFTGSGGLYISEFYGADMNREEIFYVKVSN